MKKPKIAVSLWLFHTDLWTELWSLLSPFKDDIVLYIGLCKDNDNVSIERFLGQQDIEYIISYHENYGADIQSFLHHINDMISEPYFLKIHTKKSRWGVNLHVNWRQLLWHGLIGNSNIFKNNLFKISQNNTGAVCHPTMLLSKRESYHRTKIIELCQLLDIDYSAVKDGPFMAGNMFFGKTQLYKNQLCNHNKYNILLDKIKTETTKVNENPDGTFCHALERLFGYLVIHNYHKINVTDFDDYIMIYNTKLDKYFSMIEIYDDACYLLEDPNVYGKILSKNHESYIISWLHKENAHTQEYHTIERGIITQTIR